MKTSLILGLSLLLAAPVIAQDATDTPEVMENADMSDGTTHWHGDVKVAGADSTTDLITGSNGASKGIVVDLHPSSWTRVTQEMHLHMDRHVPSPSAVLTIVYSASADFTLSTRETDYSNAASEVGFDNVRFYAGRGKVTVVIDRPPVNRSLATGANTITIYPDNIALGSFEPKAGDQQQTYTASLNIPAGSVRDNPTFCLAIPPGTGSLTFLKISLVTGGPKPPQ